MAALLCYLAMGIPGILFLVLQPYSRNANIRFHAFQSIFFSLATVVFSIVLGTFSTILAQIPLLGWVIALFLLTVFSVGAFLCWLMLMYKAYRHERFLLPVIGPFAEKQS